MVSRGIQTEDILKGIHRSVAQRLVRLLVSVKSESPVMVTGGLALNEGMMEALREKIAENELNLEIRTHEDSVSAGALGAALWAAWRLKRLAEAPAAKEEQTA
jgi:benzoyl-CoA reductase subunit D